MNIIHNMTLQTYFRNSGWQLYVKNNNKEQNKIKINLVVTKCVEEQESLKNYYFLHIQCKHYYCLFVSKIVVVVLFN